jgi:UDP-glucose:(heptosyl)LPS alpha-1,3-glucosyltransferase
MKIALALEKFSKHSGGAESYAVDLAQALVANGWEVHLFGYEWDGNPPSALFHQLKRPPFYMTASMKLLHFAFQHRSMVKNGNYDVIVGFGSTIFMNVYQSHGGAHKLSSRRKLYAIRNPALRFFKKIVMLLSPKYHVRSWIESAPFRSKTLPRIVAISDMVKNDISEVFGTDRSQIEVIYNGIDGARFKKKTCCSEATSLRQSLGFDDHILFLFMSYDFRKKGVRFLIEAASKLRHASSNKFGVVVVGGTPSPSLSRLVSKLDLDGIVVFPGSTKTPQISYNACDVFVLPTFYDACSLVVFEAMSSGLPVITSACNGASGVIEHGIDGFVINDPADSSEICDYMLALLNRDTLSIMSEKAMMKSVRYSLEENHSQMMRVFAQAAVERTGA